MEKISILIFLSVTYYKGKVKYLIWAREVLFGQKLQAFFLCIWENLSACLRQSKSVSPHPETSLSHPPKFVCMCNSIIEAKKKSFICSTSGP